MQITVNNIQLNVDYEYTPAYDGGPLYDPHSEESWPECVELFSITLGSDDTDITELLSTEVINDITQHVTALHTH